MKPHQSIILATAALLLASCASSELHFPGPSAFETGHWSKVRSSPPTYYPKGLPRDHPTNARDGYWIIPGDPADSRFFVPIRGHGDLSRDQLLDEAWAVTPPERQREFAKEQRKRDVGEVIVGAFGSFKGL